MARYLVVSLSLFLAAAALRGQNVSASLSGKVVDSSGAAFSNVEVRLVGPRTNFLRTGKTNEQGFFSFPDLLPETYHLHIAAAGMKNYQAAGIELSAGSKRSLGEIRLELGAVTESVTVQASSNPVMLASGELGGAITGDELKEMALRGRDFFDAISLLPGVVDINAGTTARDMPNPSSFAGIYIQGSRDTSKGMTIDGVSNVDTGANISTHTTPSIDTIAEVKVLRSNYSAEYGRSSGGSIVVITKGGSRQFHGTAGWYHRHENYTANNYFFNRSGTPRPPYRFNTGTYTIGGPIYIPKKFNHDRSKLFFLFSQEFARQRVNYGLKTITVPTALERTGDFSQTKDVNGKVMTVWDPLNEKTAFPGNQIPASRIHPLGPKVLGLFPLPNYVDPSPAFVNQWNYLATATGKYPRSMSTGRVDFSPKQNFQMYFRYTQNEDRNEIPWGNWTAGAVNFPLTVTPYQRPGRSLALHTTGTLSPTLFHEFTFGFSQNKLMFSPVDSERVNRTATGVTLPQWYPQNNPSGFIPGMTFGGVPNYANASLYQAVPYYANNPVFSAVENISKVYQTHTFKAGIYFERVRKDQSAGASILGQYIFDRDSANPLDTNHAYSNALMGITDAYQEATSNPQGHFRFSNLEWYVQDNWRVSRRLTLDYGLRFYHDSPEYDTRNQMATFVPSLYNAANAPILLRPGFDSKKARVAVDPISGKTYTANFIGSYVPGVGNPSEGMAIAGKNGFPNGLYNVPAVRVAPRIGFAFDPFGRGTTSIRGGVGMFYDRVALNPAMSMINNPPTVYTPKVYYSTVDTLAQLTTSGFLAPSASMYSLTGSSTTPSIYNFSFGIQQQIGKSMLADASYSGSLGRHLFGTRNINPVPAGAQFLNVNPNNADPTVPGAALTPNFLRPKQSYGDILLYELAYTSNYHSAQFSLNRRFRRGLQFGSSYTFSKVLGTSSVDNQQMSVNLPARQRNYGPLTFDRTHVFSFRYNWTMPKPGKALQLRALGILTDGWEFAGTTRIVSGAPFTPGYSLVKSTNITGTPSESARPNVADPNADPFDRFGPPAVGTWGNTGVGVLRGPGMNNWDMSLYRRIPWGEKRDLQLRVEGYNALNHTQFSAVGQTARFDATGKQIDTSFLLPNTARDARRIQLALRMNW